MSDYNTLLDTKIAIIGAGNMGSALIKGILQKGLVQPYNIIVTNREKGGVLKNLYTLYGVRTTHDNQAAVRFADIVFLAVKPNDTAIVLDQIGTFLTPNKLLASSVAGLKIDTLKNLSKTPGLPTVRIMPNTPAQVGEGVSGWSASKEVTEQQRSKMKQLLLALGTEVFFEDEELIDQVTAMSGSGPAYIFYFAEAMIRAGEEIGLTSEDAKNLTVQTIFGAAAMLKANGCTPADLRIAVTSKGGTTEAALGEFSTGGLDRIIGQAIKAAYNRGCSIGNSYLLPQVYQPQI